MEGQLWDSLLDYQYSQAGLKADYARSTRLAMQPRETLLVYKTRLSITEWSCCTPTQLVCHTRDCAAMPQLRNMHDAAQSFASWNIIAGQWLLHCCTADRGGSLGHCRLCILVLANQLAQSPPFVAIQETTKTCTIQASVTTSVARQCTPSCCHR